MRLIDAVAPGISIGSRAAQPSVSTSTHVRATAQRHCTGPRISTTCRPSRLLIRAGARPDVANDTGVTPLYLACMNRSAADGRAGSSPAGANPNAALLSGETVLMTCSRTGEAAAVRALLARGANVNAKEPSHDQTALMWAAAQAHSERRRRADRTRRRRARQVPRLHADRHQRGHAAGRPRRAELHGAARRQHGAAVCGAVGRRRVCPSAARGRRRRRTTRFPTAPARSSSPRTAATSAWPRCCSTRARTRTPPRSVTRRCMRPCSGAISIW